MRYRAVLIEPGTTQERPSQVLTNSWAEIESWTDKALQKSEDENAFVEQFETAERKVGFKAKGKPGEAGLEIRKP